MRPRTRRAVAVGCVALIVLAAVLPLGGVSLEWLIVTPAFVLLPRFTALPDRLHTLRCDERSIALLALLDPRGPPLPSSLG